MVYVHLGGRIRVFGWLQSVPELCGLTLKRRGLTRSSTGGGIAETSPLKISLYHFFNAEQAITTPALPIPPSATDFILPSYFSHSSLQTRSAVERIKASQGSRSSSVRGIPADILSMLDWGCRESPSMNGIERELATSLPIVDLPLVVSRCEFHNHNTVD